MTKGEKNFQKYNLKREKHICRGSNVQEDYLLIFLLLTFFYSILIGGACKIFLKHLPYKVVIIKKGENVESRHPLT
jgi:hypothetical protein